MAGVKIVALNELTGAQASDSDVLVIVDVSANETKKITFADLLASKDSVATATTAEVANSANFNLDVINNVLISSAIDGQVLVYESGNWVNTTLPSSGLDSAAVLALQLQNTVINDSFTVNGVTTLDSTTINGTLTATTYFGDGSNLTGIVASSVEATTLNTNTTLSGTQYLIVRASQTGLDSASTSASLTFDPATGTLSSTAFSGDGSNVSNVAASSATNASNVAITAATSGTRYLHLGSATSGNDGVEVDTSLQWNATTKELNVTGKLVLEDSATFNSIAIFAPNLPTSDPAVAGQLWVDTTAGNVIKVSLG